MVVVVTQMLLSKEIQLQQLAIVTKLQMVKLNTYNVMLALQAIQTNVVSQIFTMLNL